MWGHKCFWLDFIWFFPSFTLPFQSHSQDTGILTQVSWLMWQSRTQKSTFSVLPSKQVLTLPISSLFLLLFLLLGASPFLHACPFFFILPGPTKVQSLWGLWQLTYTFSFFIHRTLFALVLVCATLTATTQYKLLDTCWCFSGGYSWIPHCMWESKR